ncbi:MAG: hypothetical protein HOV66_01000 [Streptomycetaceae bacterium]|nr:hypothetical protein [Streptomycetaceae bacterium]
MGVLDTLTAGSPNQRSVKMCVDGALQAEWDAALDAMSDAADADENAQSLAFEHTRAAVARLDEIREKVAASQVTFLFRQLPWPRRLALQSEHPPREGNLVDQVRGFNVETYLPALVRASCVSVTDAAGDTATTIPDTVWQGLLGGVDDNDQPIEGSLNFRQVNDLVKAATEVNDEETRIPTSARSLLQSQDFGASLAQPDPGKSPRSGSAAGSRRTSPKSSTTKKATASRGRSSGT